MVVQTANDSVPGVRTFRCRSDSDPSTWYTVKRIRRPPSIKGPVIRNRWLCTCGDYVNRKMLANLHCKHIKRVRDYAIFLGGVSFVPRGVTLDVPEITKVKKPFKVLRMPRRKR